MSKQFLVPLVALLSLCGCGPSVDSKSQTDSQSSAHAHDHPDEGPHQGQLIELGKEQFHAELVHDDATHTVTIYLLDRTAKKAVTSAAKELALNLVVAGEPQQFLLPAAPESGDKPGESSRYQLSHEPLCKALDDQAVQGRLNVAIDGQDFTGEVAAHDHEHDHKH